MKVKLQFLKVINVFGHIFIYFFILHVLVPAYYILLEGLSCYDKMLTSRESKNYDNKVIQGLKDPFVRVKTILLLKVFEKETVLLRNHLKTLIYKSIQINFDFFVHYNKNCKPKLIKKNILSTVFILIL